MEDKAFISRSLLYIADFTLKTKDDWKMAIQCLDKLIEVEKQNVNFKVLNAFEMILWIATNKMDPDHKETNETIDTSKKATEALIKTLPFWWERKDNMM